MKIIVSCCQFCVFAFPPNQLFFFYKIPSTTLLTIFRWTSGQLQMYAPSGRKSLPYRTGCAADNEWEWVFLVLQDSHRRQLLSWEVVETKPESVTDHIPVAATLSVARGSQDREICRITKPADSRKADSQLDNNNYRHYSQNERTDLRLS